MWIGRSSECGKTTIYNAITAAGAASYDGSKMHRAIVNIPDPRIQSLVKMYNPPKVVPAAMKIGDIPDLKVGSTSGEGRGTKLLGHRKDVEALLHVVRCFEVQNVPFEYDTIDPVRDAETVDLELIVADSQTLHNKIQRLAKKAKAGKQGIEGKEYEVPDGNIVVIRFNK